MSILSHRYCRVDPLQGKRGNRAGYSMYAFDLDRSRYISIYARRRYVYAPGAWRPVLKNFRHKIAKFKEVFFEKRHLRQNSLDQNIKIANQNETFYSFKVNSCIFIECKKLNNDYFLEYTNKFCLNTSINWLKFNKFSNVHNFYNFFVWNCF